MPGQSQKFEAIGTGFEIDSNGNIMTADHVVAGASSIKVTFQNGSTATATLVGSDSSTDSAVIHVDVPASQLHPLTLGDSSTVLPGQTVVAIGTPLSPNYSESMSAGIVSAINRSITAPNGFSIPGTIQTDAAINHGNSGGPLIDVATNTVIGINDQIPSGTVDANVGIGFAAPIDAAKTSAMTIIAGGKVQHAYMGVRIGDSPTGGAKVGLVVAGSPAANAGLKKGDVITKYNGKTLLNADALTAVVTQSTVGEKVTLTVVRGGETKHLTMTLGNQPLGGEVAVSSSLLQSTGRPSGRPLSFGGSTRRFASGRDAPRPVLPHRAEHHPAQRVPRRRMDEREVEVAEQQRERRVQQAVVEKDGAREAEPRVLLPEPEK